MLGGLLIGFVFLLWHQFSGGSESAGTGRGRRGGVTRTELASIQIYPVNWSILMAVRPTYDPAGRNIFQFGKPPKPKVPVPTPEEIKAIEAARIRAEKERLAALEAARRAREAQASQPQAAADSIPVTPPPPPKPKPPRVTYKFIGYIGPPEQKIAVLHDGKDLIFARQGDQLGDAFRILEIGYESIKFGFTDRQFAEEYEIIPMSSSG